MAGRFFGRHFLDFLEFLAGGPQSVGDGAYQPMMFRHKGAGLLQRSPSIHGILHEIRGLGGTLLRNSLRGANPPVNAFKGPSPKIHSEPKMPPCLGISGSE